MLADIREQPWAKSLNVKFIYALGMKSYLKSYLNMAGNKGTALSMPGLLLHPHNKRHEDKAV